MEEGFIPDFIGAGPFAGARKPVWQSGTPGRVTGLLHLLSKTVMLKEVLPVLAYRCLDCGELRLFAHEDKKD